MSTQVTVPQADGNIEITVNGRSAKTWQVKDRQVTVEDDDVELFLRSVEGASVSNQGPAMSGKTAPAE